LSRLKFHLFGAFASVSVAEIAKLLVQRMLKSGVNCTDMHASQAAKEDQHRLDSKISVVSESAGLISDANSLDRIYKRICRRVLLLFVIAVILNHIDRTNLAYAAITFNRCGWLEVPTVCCGPLLLLLHATLPGACATLPNQYLADIPAIIVRCLLLCRRDLGFGPQTYGESTWQAAPTEFAAVSGFAAVVTAHTAAMTWLH
jgi:hypothetical protein